jgi:hypothetical protein
MERLTRRVSPTSYQCSRPADKFEGNELIRANQKLGKLEDIEEELGISLEVLFKALKDGIWYKESYEEKHDGYSLVKYDDTKIYYENHVDICKYLNGSRKIHLFLPFDNGYNGGNYCLKDYGKTWSLTREELE